MGWEESQFGGLGPRKPKQPKQPKKQKTHGYVSTPSQNTYQPQQTSYHVNQTYSQQSAPQSTGTRHLDANLKPTPIPKILRGIGIFLIVIGVILFFVACFLFTDMSRHVWIAIIYLLSGLLSSVPFFYWAKKLELLEEIRNSLYKDRFDV